MAETKKNTNKTSPAKKTTTTKKSTTEAKPANTKTTKKTTTTKTTSHTTHKKSNSVWGINKISFYTLGAMAILYLITSILSLCGVSNIKVISALQGVATAIAISIVAFLAWKYVKNKQTVWIVLYIVLLLVAVLGIILPLVI